MIWTDWDFDYTDQLARKYMKFRGTYYDVGTICKIKAPKGPLTVKFVGWKPRGKGCFVPIDDVSPFFYMYDSYDRVGVNDYCLEIVEPICPPKEELVVVPISGRERPYEWDVQVGWIWYIVIMLGTVIFKQRIGLWVLESIVFFGWKNGFFSNKKK